MLVGSIGYILSLGTVAWAFYTYADAFAAAAKADRSQTSDSRRCRGRCGTGSTVVLVSLLVFVASHAFGQGAVIWVFISEIFPNRVRPGARPSAVSRTGSWPR